MKSHKEQWETTMKWLDRAERDANRQARGVQSLDDKIAAQSLEHELGRIRRGLRLLVFAVDDLTDWTGPNGKDGAPC